MFLPSSTVHATLEGMSACGLEIDRVLSSSGIRRSELQRNDAMVPMANLVRLWTLAFAQAPRPTLPLEVGLRVPYGAFGPLDFITATSDSVATAFESLCAYFPAANPMTAVTVERSGETVHVRLIHRQPFEGSFVCDAFIAGVLLGRFRSGTAGLFRACIDLAMPRPDAAHAFRDVAGTNVQFEGKASGLVVDPSSYGLRMRTADRRLHDTLIRLATAVGLGRDTAPLESAIRARIGSDIEEGSASVAATARALGMSSRTLRRRLKEAGTTFHSILERLRHDEAVRLLADARLSIAEVAGRVGYRDQSSFHRAFKRWTGLSPKAARARLRG